MRAKLFTLVGAVMFALSTIAAAQEIDTQPTNSHGPLVGEGPAPPVGVGGAGGSYSSNSAPPVASSPIPPVDAGGASGSYIGGGQVYNRALDSVLRVRYNTESYGQEDGNLDLGSFKAFELGEDAITFIDGQVTLSDVQGVGYNLGVGIRFLHDSYFAPDPTRIMGLSIWSDGTSTEADNFFSQVGVSWESLGDIWDFRANGYAPVSNRFATGDFVRTGEVDFLGNTLSALTTAPFDTAFFVGEFETARRLGNRDAWGYAGVYGLNSGEEEGAGWRAGVRGYAYPDLLLQVGLSDDEIFDTNVTFSLTWFVGRTRTDYCPTCSVMDRFREPVLRNDYVAIRTTTVDGGIALTDPDGEELRFVHVDSSAPNGGNGTFENPLNNLDEILNNSQMNDIVLVHANSMFTGQAAVLQDNQRLLGEGDGLTFQVETSDEGLVDIPETSPGARDGAKPVIESAPGSAITLADNNEVANFMIDGNGVTTTGINGANAGGVTDPNLHDLMIQETTGDGIALLAGARPDTDDEDGDGSTTDTRIAFDVMLDNIMFDQVGGNDINIDADSGFDPIQNNVDLVGDINIMNIMSTDNENATGPSLLVRNTVEADGAGNVNIDEYEYDGGTTSGGGMQFVDIASQVNITNYVASNGLGFAAAFDTLDTDSLVNIDSMAYDGGTGTAGGLLFDNVDSSNGTTGVTVTNSSFMNGTGDGVSIVNDSDGIFSFNDSNTFDDIDGTAFLVNGGSGTVSHSADITNTTGESIDIQNLANGASVTMTGDVEDSGSGVTVANNNNGSTVNLLGTYDLDTGADTAMSITNNTGADISVAGLDINTTSGDGFVATGGGDLTVISPNSITTDSGVGLTINGMNIVAQATFDQVTVNNGAGRGIDLQNVTGAAMTIGTSGGDAGTLNTNDEAIFLSNVADVTINNTNVTGSGGMASIDIQHTNSAQMRVTLNEVDVDETGIASLDVSNTGSGIFRVDTVDSEFAANVAILQNSSGQFGLLWDNSTVNSSTTATAFDLDIQNGTSNVIVQGTNTAISTIDGAATAFELDVSGVGTVLTIEIEDALFENTNSSAATAVITAQSGSVLNATIIDNIFENDGSGNQFEMSSLGAATETNLFLRENTATNFELITNQLANPPFNFSVVDSDSNFTDTKNDNTGTVTFTPDESNFDDISGPIDEPDLP